MSSTDSDSIAPSATLAQLAQDIVARCSPLNFDPPALRAYLHTLPALHEQRDALGEAVAQAVVDGGPVSPHALRELAQQFDWAAARERSSESSALRHPALEQLLRQRVVPRRRRAAGTLDTLEMVPWVVGALATGYLAFNLRDAIRPPPGPPGAFHVWSPFVLLASVAIFCFVEFWMLRYDPRSRSAPLTPQRRRRHWIARGIVGTIGLVAAAGTMRL